MCMVIICNVIHRHSFIRTWWFFFCSFRFHIVNHKFFFSVDLPLIWDRTFLFSKTSKKKTAFCPRKIRFENNVNNASMKMNRDVSNVSYFSPSLIEIKRFFFSHCFSWLEDDLFVVVAAIFLLIIFTGIKLNQLTTLVADKLF